MTTLSIAPTVLNAELEQLQHMEESPIAIARQSVLTGVAPDPLLVETSKLKLKQIWACLYLLIQYVKKLSMLV